MSGADGPPDDDRFVVRDPTTTERIDAVEQTEPAAVDAVVADAAAAQSRWANRSVADRRTIIDRVRSLILERRDELAERISQETGKSVADAVGADLGPALETAAFLFDRGPELLAEDVPVTRLVATGRSTIVREPVGVVGVITPWNYPFGIPVAEVLPPLFAGNAVVMKPAEETTLTALALRDLLHEAGVPEEVFAVVPGRGPVTGAALADAAIDHLSFTGSTEVGFSLRESCAARGVSTSLELGGSDPAIVLSDADIALTAAGLTWARFAIAGQSCAAPKRVFALAPVAEELTAAIVARVEALDVGGVDDTGYEVGPLISGPAVEEIHDQVQRSVEMGATVLTGGEPLDRDGHYYAPTVLTDVTQEMPVMTEETFGPVLPIQAVPDLDTAVERANDTRFGLTGSVWTRDTDRGRAVARRIEAGTVTVNDHLYTFVLGATPWGGVKDSGGDFSHGRWGLESVTESKHLHVAPGETGVRTGRLRNPWWFPYDADTAATLGAMLATVYGTGVRNRVRAGIEMVWRVVS
ncbi:MAG: aldehyde dehydrogenase [Halobacteriaceae archaeon]